jgi:hypothetical protein
MELRYRPFQRPVLSKWPVRLLLERRPWSREGIRLSHKAKSVETFRQPPPQPTILLSPERPSAISSSVTPTKTPVPHAEAPQTPKSPRVSQSSPKVSTPTVDCEQGTVRQLDAELRLASSPVRPPTVHRSMAGTPLATSPWLGRVRPCLAPSL